MRVRRAAVFPLIGFLALAAPALAASVSVSSGSDGSTAVSNDGTPCRVVTRKGDDAAQNSTSITAGGGTVSGHTSVSPGGSGSSVTVGSGSSGGNAQASSSSAGGSDCVIERDQPKE